MDTRITGSSKVTNINIEDPTDEQAIVKLKMVIDVDNLPDLKKLMDEEGFVKIIIKKI